MNIEPIRQTLLDDQLKGIPGGTAPFALKDIGEKGWSVLNEDLPLPLMVCKQHILDANSQTFQRFMDDRGVQLAPHGKTTMCPQLFKKQLDDGAWGITAATVNQMQVYRRYGVNRIILANQLIGKQAITWVANQLDSDPNFELMVLVDSKKQFECIEKQWKTLNPQRPLSLLLELGSHQKRTGFREDGPAMELVQCIEAHPQFHLAGVEAFEGVLPDSDSVRSFLNRVARFVEALPIANDRPLIASAGGTAYFDLVIEAFQAIERPIDIMVRSGCYLTYDSGGYRRSLTRAAKEKRSLPSGLEPALEVWSYVQSRPESDLAILAMGKRDCPYDAGLPQVEKVYRPGQGFVDMDLSTWDVFSTNDQHAYLRIPESAPLEVGDMVACGISHPCTAFDKWKFIPVVDPSYGVKDALLTFF